MSAETVTFEVVDVFHITGRADTFLAGKIKTGAVRAGMWPKVLIGGGLYMRAKIKSMEFIDYPRGRNNIALALDTPEEEVREAWKALCRNGDIITIEEE